MKINPKQLKIGTKVEMEHTKNPKVAEKIATDHLKEIPDYYDRLIIMEKNAKKGKSVADYRREYKGKI